MKPSDIRVSYSYENRKGTSCRFVVAIGVEYRLDAFTKLYKPGERPPEPAVVYRDDRGRERLTSLRSFAAWAGREL